MCTLLHGQRSNWQFAWSTSVWPLSRSKFHQSSICTFEQRAVFHNTWFSYLQASHDELEWYTHPPIVICTLLSFANSSNKHETCQLVICCHRIETKRANAWVRLHTCFYAHEPSRTTSVIWEIERRDLSLLATLLRNVIVQPLFVLAFLLATVRAASQDFLWLQRIVFCQLSVIRESHSRELSLLATFSSQILSMGGARIGSCQFLCSPTHHSVA